MRYLKDTEKCDLYCDNMLVIKGVRMPIFIRFMAACILLISFSAYAEKCKYPAKPINWILRYCAIQVETDDEIVIQESSCFKVAKSDINTAEPCKMNEKYKTKICEEFMMKSNQFNSMHDCLASTRVSPYFSG